MPRPQTTIAVLGSSAGAGGAVLSACFDVVLARPSINFNYHYGAMGLSGSELRSFVLPLPGKQATERLLTDRLPVSPTTAQRLGLVDAIGPDDPDAFDRWARQVATPLADRPPRFRRPRSTPRPTGSGSRPTCGTTSSRVATAKANRRRFLDLPPERTALGQHWSGHT